jgi:hypothetical protein
VFILYAVPVGIAAGLLLGGKLDRLADLRLRWAALAVVGLLAQAALFTDSIGTAVGDAAPAIYVASTVAVLAAVLRDIRVAGMPLVALGAASNLAAILANGGYMPADPAAYASVVAEGSGYSNSVVTADPALRPLTDLFALPPGFPLANVYSLGDVLIGIGVATLIVYAMRAGRTAGSAAAEQPLLPGPDGSAPGSQSGRR